MYVSIYAEYYLYVINMNMLQTKTPHTIIFNDNWEIKRRTSGAYKVANLMHRLGWRTTQIDWVSSWEEHELIEYLDSMVDANTRMFMVSFTWMRHEWFQYFITRVTERYPGRKVVLGGQQFIQNGYQEVDVALYGYAELAVKDTIDWLFNSGAEPKGLARPDSLNGMALLDCNKHYPAMGLPDYAIHYMPDDHIQDFEQLTVELSRGCRFACKYCNYAFLGVKQDTSTTRDLLRQELIENYERWGTTNYIIADDTLNDRDSKLEMLADVVESLPFEPNFASFIRLDLTVSKPHQLELLSRARVWGHFYGVETLHPLAGKAVGKGMHPDKIKQGLLDMREHMMTKLGRYRGTLGMIAGLPHEPAESWQQSEDWLRENWSDNSWEWWPLEISIEENIATVSEFTRDWEKHGYKEITDPQRIERIHQMYNRQRADGESGVQHKMDGKSLYWTADWANIEQATEFVHAWRTSTWYNEEHLIANFHIMNFLQEGKIEKVLKMTDSNQSHFFKHGAQYNKFIKPYIQAKLRDVERIKKFTELGNRLFANQVRGELSTPTDIDLLDSKNHQIPLIQLT